MRLRTWLIIFGTASTLAGCALNSPMPPAPVSTSPVSQDKKPTISTAPTAVAAHQYLVQKGDTLYSIGRKFGIPFLKLAEFNQLPAPYEIHVGQVLNLKNVNNGVTTNQVNEATKATDDAEVVTSAIARPDNHANAEPTAPSTAPSPAPESAKSLIKNDLEAIADSDIQWQWPLAGKITTSFDVQTNKGLNITGNSGQAISAAAAGKVIYSGIDVRGYGKLVIIKHNSNLLSVYAHQGNSLVKEGTFVASGEKLANLPVPPNQKPSILHFEIRQKGKPVDPVVYLPNNQANTGTNHS